MESVEASVLGADEVVDPAKRQSGITSHTIGVAELAHLLDVVSPGASLEEYERAAIADNALGRATESGRAWRFATLRRLYLLRPDALLFRALRDLWMDDPDGRPLLAALCAMATDTVFRASAIVIVETSPGDEVTASDFAEAIEKEYPGVYAAGSVKKVSANAYASWQQSAHLDAAKKGRKVRRGAICRPADVAYALLLGHIQGHRGEALFETLWARVLDRPKLQLYDLAFGASQRGMLEFRSAGGVTEVGFKQLLRPMDGQVL